MAVPPHGTARAPSAQLDGRTGRWRLVTSGADVEERVVRYDRYALIFDPEQSGLGVDAVGLVERGIDPLYADDPDEAHRLAQQERRRLGALVVHGSLPLATLDRLLERVGSELWAGAASVVIVDPPQDRAALRGLTDRGIRWVLRAPYDPTEFRFAVAAAFACDEIDPRSGLRVPISLSTRVTVGESARAGVIRNLSIGGAYVVLPEPPAPTTRIELSFQIGDRPLDLVAGVVYRHHVASPGRAVSEEGMGVAFRGLSEKEHAALGTFIGERVGGFRL